MALEKYYLKPHHQDNGIRQWCLCKHDGEFTMTEVVETTKKEALKKSIAYVKANGGSLRVMGRDGKYKEERTYPRSADPKRSKG